MIIVNLEFWLREKNHPGVVFSSSSKIMYSIKNLLKTEVGKKKSSQQFFFKPRENCKAYFPYFQRPEKESLKKLHFRVTFFHVYFWGSSNPRCGE